MKRSDPKYVYNVKGLLIPADANYVKIARLADEYVEIIPALAEKLRDSVLVNNFSNLQAHIKTAISMLDAINARRLKSEGDSILAFARMGNKKLCEKKAAPFVANLLALSIEIQTAKRDCGGKNNDGDGDEGHTDGQTVEILTDILYNLNTVQELIEQSDYDNALSILTNMSALDNDDTAAALISILRAGEKPIGLIADIIAGYKDKIDQKLRAQAGTQWKILLVDDHPAILETVGGYLRELYKVFALTSGWAALEFLEKQRPHLFILDIDMPGMDGIALTRCIRKFPEHKYTPIIILTGNAKKEIVLSAREAGADGFLVKPAKRDMILAKISTLLL